MKNLLKPFLFLGISAITILSACNKEDSINPTNQDAKTAAISYVKITEMSFAKADGSGFDDGNGPDAFIKIKDKSNGQVVYTSTAINDVKVGDQPKWNFAPFALGSVDKSYTIELYDKDEITPDEFIGSFELNIVDNKSRTPKTIVSDGGAPKFEIEMVWGF